MSIEAQARQEAERRWPALNPGDVELTYPRGALRATARKAFEAGAVWASEQTDREPSADRARVSDGAVQRVREAIYAQIGHYPTITAAIEILSAALDGEQDTREPSADTGCPHEAFEIDTAGNPTRCADCGDHLAAVPGREPSDAEVRDEAEALYPLNRESPDVIIALRSAYRAGVDREGRAALLAAQEVRNHEPEARG